ncbi:hypothetical protein ACI4B7_28965, partial [Klebsiella pneumoniae]|uniref:copper amine oxidase n=1 Tax=Klebsiella pneumoniae TaxID=573 RepID=UPI0038545123
MLEPIHMVEIVCPTEATAKINAILSARRGQILGFDTREGLILRQLSFAGRPVMYRGSISEMVVPYADPAPNRFWQN